MLVLLAACGLLGDSSVSVPVPILEAHAAPVDAAVPPDACGGKPPLATVSFDVGDDRVLSEVACESFAYQGRYEYWLNAGAAAPVSLLSVLGMPHFAEGRLINLEKARGPGDCGIYSVWRLDDAQFTLTERRERACDAGGTVPPPEEWPLVGGTKKAAADAPGTPTHCTEKTWFTCPVKGEKVVSVCGDAGGTWLQYHFGKLGAPELVWPEAPNGLSGFATSSQTFVRSMVTALRFTRGEYTYLVVDQMGSGIDGDDNNFQGVVVRKNAEEIARLPCGVYVPMGVETPMGLAELGYYD